MAIAPTGTSNRNANTRTTSQSYQIVDYKQPYGFKEVDYTDFLGVHGATFTPFEFVATNKQTYKVERFSDSPWQRDTHSRAKKASADNGHFKDLNVMSRYVDCTLYIGPNTKVEQHDVETNTLVFNDSHTRQYVSKLHLANTPLNNKLILNIPKTWILNITVTENANDLEGNYEANDSKKSSKDKRNQVQSVIRVLNYLTWLKSDFIRQGKFASAIDVAVPTTKKAPTELQDFELLDQVRKLREPLEVLDKVINQTVRSDTDKPNVLQHHVILGVLLAFASQDAYGKDPRLVKIMERLMINDEDTKNIALDGIGVLCNIFDGTSVHYNTLNTQIGAQYLAFKPTLNGRPATVDKLLPLGVGVTYFERKEGANLIVYLINHFLTTNGAPVDFTKFNWKNDVSDKYNKLINFAYDNADNI